MPSGVTKRAVREVSACLKQCHLSGLREDGFHTSALALIEAGTVWRNKITLS